MNGWQQKKQPKKLKNRGNKVAILDTFYILFKSDSKDAEKGFKSVDNSLGKMDQSLNRFTRRWLSLYALFNGLTRSIGYAFELTQVSQALAINIADLDAWGGAVAKTGGTAQEFSKSLESLAEHLGTSPKIALQLLPKIADQFKRLNQVQAMRYGKLLGLDTHTILLLQQGRREVEALINRQKELGVVTDRGAVILKHFRATMQDTGRGFRSLVFEYLLSIIPTIDRILEKFTEFTIYLRQHSGLIKGALIPIAAIFAGIAGSAIAANLSMFLLVGSVLLLAGAFALAYDDLQVFAQGGDSLTGRMLKRWPELGNIIRWVFKDLKIAGENIVWFFGKILDIVNDIIKAIQILDKWLDPLIKGALADLKIQGANVNLFGTKEILTTAQNTPLNSLTSSGLSSISNKGNNREINLSINEIQITTQATNAREIAYGLGVELQKQLRQTQNDIAGGVLI